MRKLFATLLLLWATLGWQSTAAAHSVDKRFGDFYGGMLHPLTSLDHLLPLIGLGLLAGIQGARGARWLLVVVPLAMLMGALIAWSQEIRPLVTWIDRVSLVVIGLAVAASLRLPLPILVGAALFLGLLLGYENVAEVLPDATIGRFVPGLALAGVAVLAPLAALVVKLDRPWQQVAIRVIGSWLAAIGLMVLAL